MRDALDINEVVRAAIRRAALERDDRIALRASLFDPPPRVCGSREQLVAAIGCLLDSARQSVEGRAGAAIELETEPDGDRVAIRIVDNGPGLSEDELERIFDPFECMARVAGEPLADRDSAEVAPPRAGGVPAMRIESAASRGLDAESRADEKGAPRLADAYRIFRDHRGALMVRSRPGEGTCFVALLPVSRSPRGPRS